jgi:hypothetical protein
MEFGYYVFSEVTETRNTNTGKWGSRFIFSRVLIVVKSAYLLRHVPATAHISFHHA